MPSNSAVRAARRGALALPASSGTTVASAPALAASHCERRRREGRQSRHTRLWGATHPFPSPLTCSTCVQHLLQLDCECVLPGALDARQCQQHRHQGPRQLLCDAAGSQRLLNASQQFRGRLSHQPLDGVLVGHLQPQALRKACGGHARNCGETQPPLRAAAAAPGHTQAARTIVEARSAQVSAVVAAGTVRLLLGGGVTLGAEWGAPAARGAPRWGRHLQPHGPTGPGWPEPPPRRCQHR